MAMPIKVTQHKAQLPKAPKAPKGTTNVGVLTTQNEIEDKVEADPEAVCVAPRALNRQVTYYMGQYAAL